MTFDFTDLLGPVLDGRNGKVATSGIAAGKTHIAFYFSASWCPPCRRFTPQLLELYSRKSPELEIVFISSDREETAHNEYFAKMSWIALPYADRDRVKTLREKFGVMGIPQLVLFDARSGEVVVKDIRSLVEKDVAGHHFPYPERHLRTILAHADLIDNTGAVVPRASINGETIAFYFDAPSFLPEMWGRCGAGCGNWASRGTRYSCDQEQFNACESCYATIKETHDSSHTFTAHPPKDLAAESLKVKESLVKAYQAAKVAGQDLEIVSISFAKTAEEHAAHAASFPWLTVAFDDKMDVAFHMAKLYDFAFDETNVVVVDAARNLLNINAMLAFKKEQPFPFLPPYFGELSESWISSNHSILYKQAIVVFPAATQTAEEIAAIEATLTAISNKWNLATTNYVDESCVVVDGKLFEPDFILFTATGTSQMTDFIKRVSGTKAEAVGPTIVLSCYPTREWYSVEVANLSVEAVEHFIADFKSGKLKEEKDANEVEKAAENAEKTASLKEVKQFEKVTTVTTTTTIGKGEDGSIFKTVVKSTAVEFRPFIVEN
ncbi:thioredoxin-like-domain-containing protein [Chytriomyces sp. MP71]|nr:thioredoxin-like-domain-containing protein [Chytriomyces sp. MP71]